MRIGVHVSIAGKIYESVDRAGALGCDTMQIFSRSPRGWAASSLLDEDVQEFRRRRAERKIFPLIVHIPYLINLATPNERLYRKSVDAYIEDIKRADLLGADYFVTHLGSHTGSGEAQGIERFSHALNEIIKEANPKTMILLETTAGSGSWLGYKFEHIQEILGNLRTSENVGVCLDTAHVFEAGYDIKTAEGLGATLGLFDRLVGSRLIKVVHFNDSGTACASHADRHAHIGKGEIGLAALSRIIRHPKLCDAAFIMETPKKTDRDDAMNLKTARRIYKEKIR
jgi:deoxyribonuclease-4